MVRRSRSERWSRRRTAVLLLGLALAALTQAGCTTLSEWIHNGFKVGPNYTPPPAPLPAHWVEAHDPEVRHGDANLCAWWEVFDDPILAKLLHDSYANNLSVRAAGSQILQAQIARQIAKSELLPQAQTWVTGYSRTMASGTGGTPVGPGPVFGMGLNPGAVLSPVTAPATPVAGVTVPVTTTAGVTTPVNPGIMAAAPPDGGGTGPGRFFMNMATNLNASWELDFWGLFRRNLEAADASLDQSVNNYDELLVLLLANVATQYVEIRTLQRRLELARKNVALQEPMVAVYEKRYRGGIANAYPGYYQLLSNLENTRALIPFLEIALRQANNELCILLGQPVHDLLPALGDGTVPDPADPKKRVVRIPLPRTSAVTLDVPARYLLRRPDVRAAENQLMIQTDQVGIAEAEMLPHVGVNGHIGLASNHFRTFFEGRSFDGSIGPTLSWNVLNYGRLLANVRFQNEQFRQYVAQWQQAVLDANLDAENALVAYLRTMQQARHLRRSASAASRLTAYLLRQYREGYLPPGTVDTGAFVNQMFTAFNFQVTQEDAAAQAQGNISLNLILLYRALGGGWEIKTQHGPAACAAPHAAATWPLTNHPLLVPDGAPADQPAAPAETLPLPRSVPPRENKAKPDAKG